MNTVLVEVLRDKFESKKTGWTNGLEKFAGSCPEGFGPAFDEAMKESSQIDEEMWR